jgi:diguanylate cyclase (GGDEF)-like protein
MRAKRLIRRLAGVVGELVRRYTAPIQRWQIWSLREPLRSYIVSVTCFAVSATVFAAVITTWRLGDVFLFLAMTAAGAVVIEATRDIHVPHGVLVRDMRAVWYMSIAVLLLPPIYVLLAPIALTAYKQLRSHDGVMHRRVFSAAANGLAFAGMCLAFHAFPQAIAGPSPGDGIHILTWTVALGICGVFGLAINNAFIVGAVRLSSSEAPLREMVWGRDAVFTDLVQLSYAFAITLPVAINPFLLPATVPIVLVQRRFMMHSQLVNQTRIDGKTGLLNAATWHQESVVELARAVRTRTPLAVAVADIDHFKRVNDTLGHLSGDLALREVAHALRGSLRDYDIVGRFGGEEFTFLLPQTDAAEAGRIAERIREQVSQQVITIDDGSKDGFPLRITVSIGVASLTGSRRDLTDLIAAADSALYQAKSAGRNRVHVIADTEAPLPLPDWEAAAD